jgi:uncharacterized protein YcfJ
MISIVAASCAACGCASYRPLVDRSSIPDQRQYEYDLSDCQAYARQVDPVASAGAGAVFGAIVGAALGAAVGDHHIAQDLAAWGAVEGAAAGASAGAGTQVDVIRNCMYQRGYAVLD